MTRKRPTGKAFRAAIVVTAVAIVMNLVLDIGPTGFYATFSVFCFLVLADFGGAPKDRFMAYIVSGLIGMALIAIGASVATNLALALVVTALLVFAMAYSVLLRGYAGSAYLTLLLTYVVAVTAPQPVDTLPSALACYAAGTFIAALSAIVLWPTYQTSELSQAVSKALNASADLVAGSKPLDPKATADQSAAKMRELVAATHSLAEIHDGKLERPGNATSRDRGLVQLIDDVTRLRIALRWPSDKTQSATSADLTMLREVRDALDACGKAIVGQGPAPVIDGLVKAHHQHAEQLPVVASEQLEDGHTNELKKSLNASFYYRITAFLTAMIVRHTRLALGEKIDTTNSEIAHDPNVKTISLIESTANPTRMLRSNFTLSSPWFRRAIQSALTVTLAVAIVQTFQLAHGFWVVLGTVAALQLDAEASRKNAWGAALGTVIGFVICVVMLVTIGGNMTALLILLPIVAFFATWYPSGKYALITKQAGFTVWFILLVSLASGGLSFTIDETRIQDITIGLLCSLLVTAVLWPSGVATQVQSILDRSVNATADHFTAAYKYLTSALQESDNAEVHEAAYKAFEAKIRADDVFDMAIAQGGTTKVDATAWSSVANSIDHVFVAASMVRTMPQFGLAPISDPKVAAAIRANAAEVAHHYAHAIDVDYQEVQNEEAKAAGKSKVDPLIVTPQVAGGDKLAELTGLVDTTIACWAGKSGTLDFEVDSHKFSQSYGQSAVTMVWAQDWLLYFQWMANQTESDAAAGLKTIQSHIDQAKAKKAKKASRRNKAARKSTMDK